MARLFPLFSLFLGLALAAGCSPARTGVAGNTLSTNTKPPISITAKAPLRLMASGSLAVSIPNDKETLSSAVISFPYAVFGEGDASGPVTRHAHAILAKLEDSQNWSFQPDTVWKPRNASITSSKGPDGYTWTTQLLLVPSQGDWFSDLWVANGRSVPKIWLAKRWSALLDDTTKAIYEYREPCAGCLPEDALAFPLLDADSAARLKEFSNRAAAFTTSAQNTPLTDTAPEQTLRARPEKLPNAGKLVGEALARSSKDSSPD